MTVNYKIPDEIKSQLTEEFYSAMWEALKRVFGDDKVVGRDYDGIPKVWYLTGTCGWHDAFDECAPKSVIDFFDQLDWSDGDMFDAEIGDELSKRFANRTNADRIRAMSDEELAVICEDGCPPNHECPPINREEIGGKSACQQCWLDWLKQEAEK